jgi:hypothetical protein
MFSPGCRQAGSRDEKPVEQRKHPIRPISMLAAVGFIYLITQTQCIPWFSTSPGLDAQAEIRQDFMLPPFPGVSLQGRE